jgi:hypothetical protein
MKEAVRVSQMFGNPFLFDRLKREKYVAVYLKTTDGQMDVSN